MDVPSHSFKSPRVIRCLPSTPRVRLDQRSFDAIANDAKSHAGQVVITHSDFRNQTHRCGRRYYTLWSQIQGPGSPWSHVEWSNVRAKWGVIPSVLSRRDIGRASSDEHSGPDLALKSSESQEDKLGIPPCLTAEFCALPTSFSKQAGNHGGQIEVRAPRKRRSR
jgi:hypothetical protein